MAQRHWLDPVARRILRATGQLPAAAQQPLPGPPPAGPEPESEPEPDPQEQVERDLLELKLQQNPTLRLEDAAAVRRAASLGWRLDVNRASAGDWLRLPGIAATQVDLLLRLQAGGVQLSGADDLQRLLDLPEPLLQSWLPLLDFRWYGQPGAAPAASRRLDLNQASPQQLEALGLDQPRLSRLLRERGRGPFRDLADLQERLQLPAALVESWIGKVQFSPGPAGPLLPPASKGRIRPRR